MKGARQYSTNPRALECPMRFLSKHNHEKKEERSALMITLIIALAALAVVYGLFWHDLPAETHKKHSTNPPPEGNKNGAAGENSPAAPDEPWARDLEAPSNARQILER